MDVDLYPFSITFYGMPIQIGGWGAANDIIAIDVHALQTLQRRYTSKVHQKN